MFVYIYTCLHVCVHEVFVSEKPLLYTDIFKFSHKPKFKSHCRAVPRDAEPSGKEGLGCFAPSSQSPG